LIVVPQLTDNAHRTIVPIAIAAAPAGRFDRRRDNRAGIDRRLRILSP
jgi:hypothetical protein